ncbi:MAG TPA: hypothetical protein VGQ42_10230 [Candidatus Dormibacteraeota bacterium]|jgi:hypothetical protein|nr:hypothetical protein [Candidatus Dormibacteraeota bacterium]
MPDTTHETDTGQTLRTKDPEEIRRWAEARNAEPAVAPNTGRDGSPGVLTFDFPGGSDNLQHISWDDWLRTFQERNLTFLYQEQKRDGSPSTFFRIVRDDEG